MASLSLLENLQLNDKKDNNNDNTFQTLLFWVREHSKGKQKACWDGIQLDRVTLKNGDGVMVAKTNIAKGSKLTLPPPCVLTQDKVLSSTVGTLFSGLDIYTMFSLFILWQKNIQHSFWKPYIDILPKDISFHPITFLDEHYKLRTQEENKQLINEVDHYELLKRALIAQKKKLEGEWQRVQQLVKLHKRQGTLLDPTSQTTSKLIGALTYDDFRWANCMVISRAFNIAEPRMMCMLPLVDSMNHSGTNSNVKWRPKLVRGHFIMSMISPIAIDVELTACYHEKPNQNVKDAKAAMMANLRCYLMYGFLEEGFDDTTSFASVRRFICKQEFHDMPELVKQ